MGISKLLFIFRLPKRLLLPLLAALVIGGSYLGYQRVFASRNGEVEKFQTVDVARDTIVARVSASGPTKPLRSADLSFRSGGWVKEVLVSVGDKVAQGQPLATLEARDLELAVKRAEANLAIAKARLASVVAGGRSEDIRSAGASLESARAKLDDLKAGPKADELAIAQAAVDNAKSNLKTARIKLDSLLNPTPEDLASAQASLDSVRATLESAQARLELLTNPRSTDLIVSQARLDSAKASLKSAQSKLEELLAGATVAELASAEALVEAARIRLTNAKVDMDQLRTQLNDEKVKNIIDAC
ncbi:MAG: family efflux transporter, subunit, partial [Dehalococcoidia bacterium]|nr:family efflux transporter, subunit [Dehalococcoidia bacterium]